jgi:hypothetical protein
MTPNLNTDGMTALRLKLKPKKNGIRSTEADLGVFK